MRSFIHYVWVVAISIIAVGYACCSLSPFLAPSRIFFTDALALAYPVALLALLIAIIWSILIRSKAVVLLLISFAIGWPALKRTIAFHPRIGTRIYLGVDTARLGVMTWNVFSFLHDEGLKSRGTRDSMVQTIASSGATLLCMQEYLTWNNYPDRASMDRIMDSLGYHYKYYPGIEGNQTRGDAYAHSGIQLFSKMPFAHVGTLPMGGNSTEKLIWGDFLFKGRMVRAVTVHLSSLALYADTVSTSQSSENIYKLTYKRKGVVARKIKHLALLHEQEGHVIDSFLRKSPYPVVYCADMNSVPASYNYGLIRGDLKDAYLESGFGLGGTYDALSPTLRIDVCFCSPAFRVVSCRVNRVYLSDHFPVTTWLEWQ